MNTFVGRIKEIYQYRYILRSLIVKNLIGRYRNSFLGFSWHFITPFLLMFVYYVLFTGVRPNPMPNFWVYLISALFPFTFMMSCVTGSTGVIVGSGGMIKKMYFPRAIVVLSFVFSNFIVMLIGYSLVLAAVFLSGFNVDFVLLLWLPFLMIFSLIFSIGVSLLLSSITVYVRDLQYLINSISIVIFMTTPMYFTIDSISGVLSKIIWFNPLTYFVQSFHDVVYYGVMPDLFLLSMVILLSIIIFFIGWLIFDKLQGKFVEKI